MARFVCVDAETFEVGRAAWPRHHFSHIFGNIVDFRIKKKKKKKNLTETVLSDIVGRLHYTFLGTHAKLAGNFSVGRSESKMADATALLD